MAGESDTESSETVAALRSEISRLKRELGAAWTAELQMVERAKRIAHELFQEQARNKAGNDLNGGRDAEMPGTTDLSVSHPLRDLRNIPQSPRASKRGLTSPGAEKKTGAAQELCVANIGLLKRQRTTPTTLFDLSKPGEVMAVQDCHLATRADSLATPTVASIAESKASLSNTAGSSEDTSPVEQSRIGMGTETHRVSTAPSKAFPGSVVAAAAASRTERRNGRVLLSPVTPPSPLSCSDTSGSTLMSPSSPMSPHQQVQEHALKLIQLLPCQEIRDLPLFAKEPALLSNLTASLLKLATDDGVYRTSSLGDGIIPSVSLVAPPSISMDTDDEPRFLRRNMSQGELTHPLTMVTVPEELTIDQSDSLPVHGSEEVSLFNDRQTARLVSPLSRALGSKAVASSLHHRLRSMSISKTGSGSSDQPSSLAKSAIAKSKSRSRVVSEASGGYSSDPELASQSPTMSRSLKTSTLPASTEKPSSWYGSLRKRSRKVSTSELAPSTSPEHGTTSAGLSSCNGVAAGEMVTSAAVVDRRRGHRSSLDLPHSTAGGEQHGRFDGKLQHQRSCSVVREHVQSQSPPSGSQDSVFEESMTSSRSSTSIHDEEMSISGGSRRSSSLKIRRSSREHADGIDTDHLKVSPPLVAGVAESPRSSPATGKRFPFFTLNRQRRRTEPSSDESRNSPEGRLADALDEIFLPTACKHPLKYITDSSLHWFHVASCYDTWPIHEDTQFPFLCSHVHHRHNKPHSQMEKCCAKQPECSLYSYCTGAEWKFQLSLWELLRSEVVYLVEALLVLQDVHGTILARLQRKGHLSDVDYDRVFGNVAELSMISELFSEDLLSLFSTYHAGQATSLEKIINILNRFVVQFHTPYQHYGANYHQSMPYVDELLERKDFQQYAKFCHVHSRVRKRSLKSFLFEPVQRLQRLPMLLKNIVQDYHGDRVSPSYGVLSSAAKAIEVSCHELDALVKQYLQEQTCAELQSSIQWPTVFAVDSAGALPDSTEKLLTLAPLPLQNQSRWLVHHSPLRLLEYVGSGITTRLANVMVFLFNDLLLITRHRPVVSGHKASRFESPLEMGSKTSLSGNGSPLLGPSHHTSGQMEYYVCKQPYPVSQIEVLDLPTDRNFKHTFCVLLKNLYQQYVGGISLDAPSERAKAEWMQNLRAMRRQRS